MDNEDRDELLVRIEERVISIHDRLDVGDKRLNDHAVRLRTLERWRTGIVTAIGALLAFIKLVLK